MDSGVLCLQAQGSAGIYFLSWNPQLLSSLNFLSWPSRPDLPQGTGTGPGQMTFCSRLGLELKPGVAGESVLPLLPPVA